MALLRTIQTRLRRRFFPVNDKRPLTRREPFLAIGLPFMTGMLGATFLLSKFTQLRYDAKDSKTGLMSQNELTQIRTETKDLASTDVRELYFQLTENARTTDKWDSAPSPVPKPIPKANRRDKKRKFEDELKDTTAGGDWEVKRVERPEGLAEWGEQPKTPEERKIERERKLV